MSRGQAEECVEPTKSIAGAERGLRWRTRLTATRTAGGIGMHLTRSHGLIDVHDCPITDERVIDSVMDSVGLGGGFRAAVGTDGRVGTVCRGGSARVTETITTPRGTQTWSLPVGVFWQVHRGFPQVLGDTVLSMAGDVAGERWWDLYVGAGLLNAFIIDAGALMVDAVESDPRACTAARRALHDRPEVILHEAGVETWLGGHRERPPGVVLDPPRSGCERTVTQQLVSLRVPRIVFVACDPASLARDVRILRSGGYEVDRVVPVDAFPMTHHVETLMLLRHGNPLS
jgi:tRNA/tmRNA/rRNA uracil-C5-methylase (TrmA/RlmC/RlmD family)